GLDFFSGIIWIFYVKVGFSEIWAYWLYITTILSLNSFGLFILSQHFLKNIFLRWSCGLIFSVHYFTYLNIDNPNVLFYFTFFLAIFFFLNFIKNHSVKYLYFAIIAAALQIYFSPYVFVFLFIVML